MNELADQSYTSGTENRRYKRWDIFEYALLQRPGDTEADPSIVVDLSLGGMQVRSRRAYAGEEICLISIADDHDVHIETYAEVRYCSRIPGSDLYSIGLRFTPGSVEQRVRLVDYIHDRFRSEIESIAG